MISMEKKIFAATGDTFLLPACFRGGTTRFQMDGDMGQIEELYQRYAPMVARRCTSVLGNEERGLEAMQEVFVLVMRHYPEAPVQGSSSLLYRMATNVSLNILRKERGKLRDDIPLELLCADEDLEERSLARHLLDRIFMREGTQETTRTIAYCHFVDGMTLEEVAEVVGMSVSGVRKRIARLKEKAQELKGGQQHVTKNV